MSSASAYDVDPDNLVDVGYSRSGILWAYKEENISPLRSESGDDSDFKSKDAVCVCGWDSPFDGPIPDTKAEALGLAVPLVISEADHQAAGPSGVPSEASPILEVIKPEWLPIKVEEDDDSEDDLDSRVLYIEKEEAARVKMYEGFCLQAWLSLASHTLHTDESGRDAFIRRPNWGLLENVINSALAKAYTGPGKAPTLVG